MDSLIGLLLLVFFVLPIVGGALAFAAGGVYARFEGKADGSYHPLNPFYRASPYDFIRR